MMRYVDCTVTIEDEKKVTLEYPLEGNKVREVEGNLSPDPFAYLTVERLNHWVNYALKIQEQDIKKRLYDIKDLRVIGLNLYRILFGDEKICQQFMKAFHKFDEDYQKQKAKSPGREPELRMRLKLVFGKAAEKLATLPWEFLFVPGPDNDIQKGFFFAGQKTELILTRYVPSPELQWEVTPEKLRILVVISSPKRIGAEALGTVDPKETEPLIKKIKDIANAEVRDRRDLPYDELKKEIADFRPHILHFIGHGRPGELGFAMSKDDPEYDLETEGEQGKWVPGEQFRFLFEQYKPRLVFLHACKGAVTDSLAGFNSTARELVYADIPAVVAMQYSISNQDAGTFARKFYEELGKGYDIDEAVKAGRLELGGLYPAWAHPRFGTPVVYLQTDKAIVAPVPELVTQEPARVTEAAQAPVAGVRISPNVVVMGSPVQAEPSAPLPSKASDKLEAVEPPELDRRV